MTDVTTTLDSCTFCDREVEPDAHADCHSLCHRRLDIETGADAVTERFACPHCFGEILSLTGDMMARDVDATDTDALAAVADCSFCGNDFDDDASLELLAVDDTCYVLCAGCSSVFDQFCSNVPESEPEGDVVVAADGGDESAAEDAEASDAAAESDTEEAADAAEDESADVSDESEAVEAAGETEAEAEDAEITDEASDAVADEVAEAADDTADETVEHVADEADEVATDEAAEDEAGADDTDDEYLHDADEAATAAAAADASDLKNVLDSGLDDVETDDQVRFDIRRDSRDGSSEISTVDGTVTRAETSYIGGSTIYVDGDDGEEYRLESSFSSEAVRISTVAGHDLDFRGHLDALARIE
ncbi:hypothetical protein [Haloarchaeobius sp. DFWS5]|uniref:hypothetical protein n=1 Tax=Haloarchaeobius sp. DFWS5 TaxID=3446114 RepID=UPI003EBF3B66